MDIVEIMPNAADVALTLDNTLLEGGDNKMKLEMIGLKWKFTPVIVIAGCLLNYVDLFLDLRVALSFQNRDFPPINYYVEGKVIEWPGLMWISFGIMAYSVVATCIIDYLMEKDGSKWSRILFHFLLNLTFTRMLYESIIALTNWKNRRWPQAGLAEIKAAEGLTESLPQIMLQMYVITYDWSVGLPANGGVFQSICVGLFSITLSLGMLPEKVKTPWRAAFIMLLLVQIALRVLCLCLFFAFLKARDASIWILFTVLILYISRMLMARPYATKRIAKSLMGGNVDGAKREMNNDALEQRVKQVEEYTVLVEQTLQEGPKLNSKLVHGQGGYDKQVQPGDVVRTTEIRYLSNGIQRVKLKTGWLSLQSTTGSLLMVPKHLEAAIKPTLQERVFLGVLNVFIPVQLETIKNLAKSDPRAETNSSFFIRLIENFGLSLPYTVSHLGALLACMDCPSLTDESNESLALNADKLTPERAKYLFYAISGPCHFASACRDQGHPAHRCYSLTAKVRWRKEIR